MLLDDLIAELERVRDELDDDADVRVATQPIYPLTSEILHVTVIDGRVWIATDQTHDPSPYAPAEAWG